MANYFELFNLTPNFLIDKNKLEQIYNKNINQYHPDKFISASETEKVAALNKSEIINNAYNTLSNDLKRASYLLELAGIGAFSHNDTQMQSDFLERQIGYQEQLENLKDEADIEEFVGKISSLETQYITDIAQSFKHQQLTKVKNLVRELKFYQQLKQRANAKLDELL